MPHWIWSVASALVMAAVVAAAAPSATQQQQQQQQQKQAQQQQQRRQQQQRVLYLPLDERFTTRNAFLNLAKVTPFEIVTPPVADISLYKRAADLAAVDAWVAANAPGAAAFVVSLEMYLYGGLIQSRTSNTTLEAAAVRLQQLVALRARFPALRVYVSAVVMRIPSYNGDFEEPWYWADYGGDLFQ